MLRTQASSAKQLDQRQSPKGGGRAPKGGKGDRGGKSAKRDSGGKGFSKGGPNGEILESKTPDGRDICFNWNYENKGCTGGCGRVHICRVRGCWPWWARKDSQNALFKLSTWSPGHR